MMDYASLIERLERYNRDIFTESATAIKHLIAENAELRAKGAALARIAKLREHQVITCGVAARHPDANISRTGVYAGKWNSQQADDVRTLRDRCDKAEAELAAIKAQPQVPENWREFVMMLSLESGGMLNGNRLSRVAKELLAATLPAVAPTPGNASDAPDLIPRNEVIGIIHDMRDSICAGGEAITASMEESVVRPYLDSLIDEVLEIAATNFAAPLPEHVASTTQDADKRDTERLNWIEQELEKTGAVWLLPCGEEMRFVQVRTAGECRNYPMAPGGRAAIDAAQKGSTE